MKRPISIAAVLAVSLALAAPGAAGAATSLDRLGEAARWSGSISNSAVPSPAACTELTCRTYELEVRLPAERPARPRGLLVSLQWPSEQLDVGYDLDLYVYGPSGALVEKSDAVVYSAAEGLWLQSPANGRYRVVVAPRDVVGTSPFELVAVAKRGYSFETTASFLGTGAAGSGLPAYEPTLTFLGRPPRRTRPMLPDLVPVKPGNFHIESTAAVNFYQATQRVPAHQPSCYPQETTGLTADDFGHQPAGALRCLRWDMSVRNAGRGPFELRAYPESETPESGFQALYRSDGSYSMRKVGDAKFSSAHGHVHFHGLDEVGLYTYGKDGQPGTLVKEMPDKGICMIDLLNPNLGRPADGPSRYRLPGTCDAEGNVDPADPVYPDQPYFRMGLSSGWEDIYPWFIPDQYVDITDVPDGRYVLVYRVNVSGAIVESSRRNNATSACVEFSGTTVDPC